MTDYLSVDKEFNMLSLPDLLEARDFYHVHLMHKANVIATAVGRYLIRKSDSWPTSSENTATQRNASGKPVIKGKRTLDNSEVRPYSWPCILVFVEQWVDADQFGHESNQINPDDKVERAIYLRDGKVVPICVVEAPRDETSRGAVGDLLFPDNLIGGGFPVIANVQEEEHVASIGCMVSDGHTVYALTNRHVAGAAGEVVYSRLGGETVRIGKSSRRQLTRRRFEEVYAEWPGKNVYVNLDIGLIEVDDKKCWTAQVYGIGQMGKLADLSINNISLKLIGCPVRAYGCASGQMYGTIQGLFYRYKSIGGFEYVSDFLIGPQKDKPFNTQPGDSGTVWMLDTGDEKTGLMPIAIQWGGHVFVDQSSKSRLPYALATCLSTVCNLLEVDVVRDWNIGQVDYWGEMGHYTIGAKACTLMSEPGLKILMEANIDRVGFDDDSLKDPQKYQIHQAQYSFVPLADVADNVWRNSRPPFGNKNDPNNDANNHFADMDQPGGPGPYEGQTLLELCQNSDNVSVQVWNDFYDSLDEGTRPGVLPLRVWQIYNEMVKFLNGGQNPDIASFLCAAGCLAHYVGDACQPLHVSRFHHGYPPLKPGTVPFKVHEVYETAMLNTYPDKIVDGINGRLSGVTVHATFQGGKGAALRVIDLMRETINLIDPETLVKAYNEEKKPGDRIERLWNDFGDDTMTSMANGCRCLGEIWESAWAEGGGQNIPHAKLKPIDIDLLTSIYRKNSFLLSRGLKDMGPLVQ
jgi:hypothetical protein